MTTAVLVTVMICTTLLIISRYGVNIKIDKNYNQTFKDETSFQEPKGESTSTMNIKDLLKQKEDPKEVEDFIRDTTNTFEDYFKEEEEKVDGQRK